MGSVSPADIIIPIPNGKSAASSDRAIQQSRNSTALPIASADQKQPTKRFRIADILLRSATMAFLVVSLCAMLTSSQTEVVQVFGISFTISMKWTTAQPFKFLVIVAALICGYALLQFICQSVILVRRASYRRNYMWLQCGADQACAYLVLSAAAAAAGASRMNKGAFESLDVHNFDIPSVCKILDRFCNRATIAIIFTLLAAVASACCAALDVYILSSYGR